MTPRRHEYTLTAPGPGANPYVTPTTTPTPSTPATTPTPTTNPMTGNDWWKTRGGHELYAIFDRIYKENPMAGMAFWNQVVGRGRGENDLMAATIHKMFGGDMNAYNQWRNTYHNQMLDSYAGNFDLNTGKWTPGAGFNSQYVKDRTGWDVQGPWQASWNWGDYSGMQPGLQSTPGNEGAGSESWNTYGAGVSFGPQGVAYPNPAQQNAIAANTGAGVPKVDVNAVKGPGTFTPTPPTYGPSVNVGPGGYTGMSTGINREAPGSTVTNPYASHSRDNVFTNPYSPQTDVNTQPVTGTPMGKDTVQTKSNPYFFQRPNKWMQGWR